jgi:hypothetical protein
LQERIDDHEERIENLEDAVAALENQIKAGAMISSVDPLPDGKGWRITFTGGTLPSIDILNGKDGADGTDGADGRTPLLEVRKNPDGTSTVWVNYGDGKGWIDTGTDISGPQGPAGTPGSSGATGPVASIVNNSDGTVTVNTGDGQSYTFERSSTAVRFEILTFDAVSIAEGETGEILFAVNPSTAWVPTGTGETIAAWELDDVGKRTDTRAGYVNASPDFAIKEIAPASSVPAEQGKYIATIECTASDPGFRGEYMVSLVLDTNKAAGGTPVLISSAPFALKSVYNGPAIRITNGYNGRLDYFAIAGSGEATIDWGDGSPVETVTLYPLDEYGYMPQNGKVIHTYYNNNERTIAITGTDITGIQSDGSFGEYNNGTAIDVSGMTSLQFISFMGNNFTSVDVSGLDDLRYLNCSYNYSLNSLNLDGCVALNTLLYNNTVLESIDVTNYPELTTLDCSHSGLTSLNMTGLEHLEKLYCSGNTLTSLDVTYLTELKELECFNSGLTSLKVTGLEKLEKLSCHGNALTSLDVKDLPLLRILEASQNRLEVATIREVIADLPDRTGKSKGMFKVNSYNGDTGDYSPIATADKDSASAKGWSIK